MGVGKHTTHTFFFFEFFFFRKNFLAWWAENGSVGWDSVEEKKVNHEKPLPNPNMEITLSRTFWLGFMYPSQNDPCYTGKRVVVLVEIQESQPKRPTEGIYYIWVVMVGLWIT